MRRHLLQTALALLPLFACEPFETYVVDGLVADQDAGPLNGISVYCGLKPDHPSPAGEPTSSTPADGGPPGSYSCLSMHVGNSRGSTVELWFVDTRDGGTCTTQTRDVFVGHQDGDPYLHFRTRLDVTLTCVRDQ